MTLARIRTAEEAFAEIKKEDPGTSITLSYVRRIIREEKVPVLVNGRKKLVNVDDVIAFLNNGGVPIERTHAEVQKIRRVV